MPEGTGTQGAANGGTQGAANTVDQKTLEGLVQGAVKSGLEQMVSEAKKAQDDAAAAAAAEEARKKAQGDQSSAVGDWLKPHLQPMDENLKTLDHRTTMAQDAAVFYTDERNKEAFEYRERVEEVVQREAKRGNVISRKDAWNWLRGGELYDTIQKKRDESRVAAEQQKIKEAQDAQTAGPSVGSVRFEKDPEQMSTDELGKALSGVKF